MECPNKVDPKYKAVTACMAQGSWENYSCLLVNPQAPPACLGSSFLNLCLESACSLLLWTFAFQVVLQEASKRSSHSHCQLPGCKAVTNPRFPFFAPRGVSETGCWSFWIPTSVAVRKSHHLLSSFPLEHWHWSWVPLRVPGNTLRFHLRSCFFRVL